MWCTVIGVVVLLDHFVGSRTNSRGQDIVRQIVAAVTAAAAVGVASLRTRRS